MAAGTSAALDTIVPHLLASALGAEVSEVGAHKVAIITDAPGLGAQPGELAGQGSGILHFDLAFEICGPAAALQDAVSDKRGFEHRFARTAAEKYEAFAISTIRLLTLESLYSSTSATVVSTTENDKPGSTGAEEQPTFLEQFWWLPWLGCATAAFAAACTWLIFRLRRKYKKEPTPSFDAVSRSAALPDLPDPGWAWQRDYYACAVHAFDPEETQLGSSALRFEEGDLLQVEAKVDAAWLYGHAAKDPERAGFFPENRVRRLGSRVPSQPPPLAKQGLPERGFEVKAKSSYQPEDALEAKKFLRVLAGDFLEILRGSEGWLYGRTLKAPSEFGFFPETCLERELPSDQASACAGPRLAAAGTASWTQGAQAFEPDRAQEPNAPSRPQGKPVRSFSRQLTGAIASTLCTGSFQVNRS